MYEMSQRHPVWVLENHVNPCNSVWTHQRQFGLTWQKGKPVSKCALSMRGLAQLVDEKSN
jgi:hypothetical protein